MNIDFKDKVVLITGAAAGIGAEAARQFATAGASLMLSDNNAEALHNTVKLLKGQGFKVEAKRCDVTDEQQVKSLVDACINHFGQLDIAINNAGVDSSHCKLADVETQAFDQTMAVNVRGVFLCMKYQLPKMVANKGGAIVNVSSVAGVVGTANMSVYAASKHAVIGLTKSAAQEYGRNNIRINAVCPYITQTEMFEAIMKTTPNREKAEKDVSRSTALNRIAQPKEVAQAMLWACSDNNSYMTGHELMIDGGMTAI